MKHAENIIKILKKMYPAPRPSLNFKTPFELLVASILSAQCTDERVNIVTGRLFATANTPEKIAKLGKSGLIKYIKPTGFFRAKAKNIIAACKKLITDFDGKIPRTLEQLQTLPGVGRKTASVVLAQAFHIPAFPVDRHVLRVANRLGLAHAKTPDNTDMQLRAAIPEKLWIAAHMQLVLLGRQICRPKPKCEICPLLKYCPEGQKRMKQKSTVA